MTRSGRSRSGLAFLSAMAAVAAVVLGATLGAPALAVGDEETSPFPGLERVEGSKVGTAYIDPDADFGVFKRIAISDPYTDAFQEAQARRIFEEWARTLRAFLDEHYSD